MNHLGYSYLENFENNDKLKSELEKLPNNIQSYVDEEDKFNRNSDRIKTNVDNIKEKTEYIKNSKDNKKEQQNQMINDYHSIVMQQKFVLAVGGITLLSLIILNTQI
tara:strand:- start:2181 stop:2501 length:321 start_codon:yes stop_codon:yes gene_type:complete